MTQQPLREPRWGMVQVYTGDGKGKTTAALGLAVRAAAIGKRVAWIAFDKGGDSHYSERQLIQERIPEICFEATGLDRIDPDTKNFRFGVLPDDVGEGNRALRLAEKFMADDACDLLVLDEVNISAKLGIVSEQEVVDLLEAKPPHLEIVLTGRDAPASFLERADLVTEMTHRKHYYQQGVAAREGLDY
jgi:cob(I)alamin adenosyltransferase